MKLAAAVTVAGALVLSVSVGFFDWRVGGIVFGIQLIAAGAWTLLKE